MAKLNANTTVMRPDTLEVVTLAEGDEVPDWADGLIGDHLIGDHLIEDEKPKRAASSRVKATESKTAD